MNCPSCGRMMQLFHAPDIGMERMESAFFWQCVNDIYFTKNGTDCWQQDRGEPFPDRRYDWEWWGEGISEAHLLDDFELAQEYIQMWEAYPRKSRAKAAERRKVERLRAFISGKTAATIDT